MKTASLLLWLCAASVLVACGGKVAASTGSNNGNGPDGIDKNVDPGPPAPSGGGPSSWGGPSGPTPIGFFVDGVACGSVVVHEDAKGAPCGRTWMLNVNAFRWKHERIAHHPE